MNIEKGMYIRTNEGEITKIKSLSSASGETKNGVTNYYRQQFECDNGKIYTYYDKDCYCVSHYNNEIKKPSHNIIDLIEVGDLVNGWVVDAVTMNKKTKLKTIWVYNEQIAITEDEIETILTHEQIEAHSFQVGE